MIELPIVKDHRFGSLIVKDVRTLNSNEKNLFYFLMDRELTLLPKEIICNNVYNKMRFKTKLEGKGELPDEVNRKMEEYEKIESGQMSGESYAGEATPLSLTFNNGTRTVGGIQLYAIHIMNRGPAWKIKAHPFPILERRIEFGSQAWLDGVADLYEHLVTKLFDLANGETLDIDGLDPITLGRDAAKDPFIGFYSNEIFGRLVLRTNIECRSRVKDTLEYCEFGGIGGKSKANLGR